MRSLFIIFVRVTKSLFHLFFHLIVAIRRLVLPI